MRKRSWGKKALLTALIVANLSAGSVLAATVDTAVSDSPMQAIYAQSAYNPHLQDANVPDDASIVTIESGQIRGTIHDKIYRYRGVPYAEAKERFVKAEAVTPWQGVKDMTEYGPQCPQYVFGTDKPVTGVATSNNDQNLNIWTPSLEKDAGKPVMVWFHGGGFSSGSANEAQYDGENLSRKGDVVVVSVNHRLNALGHLNLSAYGKKYADSANVGGTDLVQALQWIQRNIEQFGGDPKNVTLFGESGGGAKVLEMMSTPEAQGLFQKGIVESGATETMGVHFMPLEQSQAVAAETLKNLNITPAQIEDLQTMPIEKIWQASDKALKDLGYKFKVKETMGTGGYGLYWEPVSGTEFLPTDPVTKHGFAKTGKKISLLIGSNLTEWGTIFPFTQHTDMTQEQKDLFAQAYPNEDPKWAPYVDTMIRQSMLEIMSHKAKQKGDVYAYVFTKQVGDGTVGVYHTSEIPYVFSNTPEPSPLADQMTALWANFAWTGIPFAKGVPVWQPYNYKKGGYTMILDDQSVLVRNHDKALMQSLVPDFKY